MADNHLCASHQCVGLERFALHKLAVASVPAEEKPSGGKEAKLVTSTQWAMLTDVALTVCRAATDSRWGRVRWQVSVADSKASPRELGMSGRPQKGSVGHKRKVRAGCDSRGEPIRKTESRWQAKDTRAGFPIGRGAQPCSLEDREPLASWASWVNESGSRATCVACTEASGWIQGELGRDEAHRARPEESSSRQLHLKPKKNRHRCSVDADGGDYARLAFQSFLQLHQHRRLHRMGCRDVLADPLSPVSSISRAGFGTKPVTTVSNN